jgi:hypothetical protein
MPITLTCVLDTVEDDTAEVAAPLVLANRGC